MSLNKVFTKLAHVWCNQVALQNKYQNIWRRRQLSNTYGPQQGACKVAACRGATGCRYNIVMVPGLPTMSKSYPLQLPYARSSGYQGRFVSMPSGSFPLDICEALSHTSRLLAALRLPLLNNVFSRFLPKRPPRKEETAGRQCGKEEKATR